ncbi:unnamed protein product, partial [Rotaria magnacalcarata]
MSLLKRSHLCSSIQRFKIILKKIPIYLTQENKTFQSIIDQALGMMNISSIAKDNIRDDLQHASILIY